MKSALAGMQRARAANASRRGAFTVILLVCLLISTMLLGALLKCVLQHDRQMGRNFARVQAGWLAESALDRAAQKLSQDSRFEGETWNVDADRLGGADPAAVVVRIEKTETQPQQRLIVVEATYPSTGADRARVTRQAIVTLKQEP